MGRKILTEEIINEIIEEELGIANDAMELSSRIENEIYKRCGTHNEFRFSIDDSLTVDFLYKNFNDADEYYKWYSENKRRNGYSYQNNTMYINIFVIGGVSVCDSLTDTIQHECLHYIECKKKGKDISTDRYQNIVNGTDNRNPVVASICRILYYANKNEINAFVNGTYADAMKKKVKYSNYKDFIRDNSVSEAYAVLKNAGKTLEKYNMHNPLFVTALFYLIGHGIVNDGNPEQIINRLYETALKAYKYLIRKIGMAYSLYMAKMEEEQRISDEAEMKRILKGNKL